MNDPTQPEGTAEQVNQELPTPKFTDVSPDSATSSVDTKAIAREVADILRPDFERVAQSTKDKRIAEIQKRLGMGDLAELEGLGVQIPDNVKLEYRLRQIEEGRQSPEASRQATTSQGSGANLTAHEVSEVVKQYGLDANTPEVLDALRGSYRNRDHFENTLAKLALKQTNRPTPDAASSSSIPSRSSASPDVAAQIEKGYLEAIAKVPRGNIRMVNAVKAEWKKKAREVGLQLNV